MRELFLFQTWNLEILVSTWPWKENHDKLGLSSSCVISLALCLPLPFSWLLVCLRVPVDLDLQSWTLLASLFVSEQSCWQIPLFSWSLCFFSLHQYPLYLHKRKKKRSILSASSRAYTKHVNEIWSPYRFQDEICLECCWSLQGVAPEYLKKPQRFILWISSITSCGNSEAKTYQQFPQYLLILILTHVSPQQEPTLQPQAQHRFWRNNHIYRLWWVV